MQPSASVIICSYCGEEDNQTHPCRADLFTTLNRIGSQKKENPFSDIENLVFQGGGVKGIAYVGVFRSLLDEYKIRDQIKRVAGSSAGAIAALYLCLGLGTEEIAGLLETNLLDKLDDQPTVTVDDTEFPVKQVFSKILDFYGNHSKQDIVDLVSDIISNILKKNFGWTGSIASFFGSDKFAEMVANYVFLAPRPEDQKTIAQKVQDLEQEIKEEEAEYDKRPLLAMPMAFSWWPWSKDKPTLEKKEDFHSALSDLIEQTFMVPNPKFADGWFAAETIKADLIIEPIRKAYERIGQLDLFNKDLTFKDMADVKVDGKPAFKKLYVTAFNGALGRTDIFSVDHTPNVVVADAVRASMSIPVFFKTVKIRQRVGDSLVPRQIFSSLTEFKDILYMDGGIMDNFAMWIFDDLQYCVGESFAKKWIPQHKLLIRNPATLGVKLINSDQRLLYLHPYLDQEFLKQKVLKLPVDPTPMRLISRALMSDIQDDFHIHRGDTSRTIYVDNLGVTAVSFALTTDEMKTFEKAGELAVRQYVNYYRWGKLSGIGERYIAIDRAVIIAEPNSAGK